MNEEIVLRVLAEQGIDLVASLPCDKNKRLTALLPTKFPVIDESILLHHFRVIKTNG